MKKKKVKSEKVKKSLLFQLERYEKVAKPTPKYEHAFRNAVQKALKENDWYQCLEGEYEEKSKPLKWYVLGGIASDIEEKVKEKVKEILKKELKKTITTLQRSAEHGEKFCTHKKKRQDPLSKEIMKICLSFKEKNGRLPHVREVWKSLPLNKYIQEIEDDIIYWKTNKNPDKKTSFKSFQHRLTKIKKKIAS